LGRGEIRGLSWEDYGTCEFHDGQQLQKMLALQVRKSVWNGITSEPKTKARKAPVPVIGPLAQMLDAHRRRCGNPSTGPIFANHEGKAACMNNLRNRQVMPALRRCATCGKSRREHRKAGHAFLLDTSCPQWHGWHAFRRGLATNLHHMGVPDKVIQLILRHENVAVTQKCYIKTFTPDAAAAMRRFEEQLPATAAVQ
jgi:integrase